MVPIDSPNIAAEYHMLCHELERYNPSLINKRHRLVVTKIDIADSELVEMVSETLPPGVLTLFISAVAQKGLTELKDLIWQELNLPTLHDPNEILRQPLNEHTIQEDDDPDNPLPKLSVEEDHDLINDIVWEE